MHPRPCPSRRLAGPPHREQGRLWAHRQGLFPRLQIQLDGYTGSNQLDQLQL